MGIFQIEGWDYQWITGAADDPDDLCLHGKVRVRIGDTVLEDTGTVSATALYLLKSLTEDKVMGPCEIKMIPCCGHFLIANDDLTEVTISGCDNGTDWSVLHENGQIKLVLPSGQTEWVDEKSYREAVFRFADSVEAYYRRCTPKRIPKDDFERKGYCAFWNEWRRRRGREEPPPTADEPQ